MAELVGVIEVGAEGEAGGETGACGSCQRARVRDRAVVSPGTVGLVARMISGTPPAAIRDSSASMARSSGPTPSTGEINPPST